jgi:hypothetical protein
MQPYLATTINGLSNRLKNLISVLRLCDKSKSTFLQFNDIFENDFVTLDTSFQYIPLCTWRILVNDSDIEIPDNFNKATLDLPERHIKCRDVDSEFDRIPMVFREKILNILESFSIKKQIIDIVDDFKFNNITGIHVRTWYSTYHSEYDDWSKFLRSKSNENYLINFEKILTNTNQKIFLSCDDFKLKFYLKNKYSNLITYDRTDTLSDVQNDFIDMLLLSKCNILYGTRLSTFTEMSWWFSKCNQTVILS